MDFDYEPSSLLDEERLSSPAVNINTILQLASSPPDDLVRGIRPAILRSRRTPMMPILSSSPPSIDAVLPSSLSSISLSSSISVNTPASSDTPSTNSSLSNQSICLPPSPPPLKNIGKERKLVATILTKDIDPSFPSQSDSLSSSLPSSSSSSQLDVSDFECSLCFQIYFQPVTTPCGHVFCKQCLFRAIKHSSACPLCRSKLDSSINQKYSVNIVLMNIIEKYFPKEHRERASEEEDNQKNEEELKPENEENMRPNSPSNWGCILPSLRSTCTVLLSCGGF